MDSNTFFLTGKGKCSPSCTTFNCRQLSGKPEFSIDMIEVWAVGPEPTEEDDETVSYFRSIAYVMATPIVKSKHPMETTLSHFNF